MIPEAGGENEIANRAVFDASLEYWRPIAGRTPGATTLEEWNAAAQFLEKIGMAAHVVPGEELFTNDFVPQ